MDKKISICSMFLIASTMWVSAQTQETVNIDSGSQTLFNQGNTALSGGTSNDGDGDVLQLGYFTTSTATFSGTFIPLTGDGSVNSATISGSTPSEPYNKTSIGDLNSQGGTDGTFFIPGLTFVVGNANSGNSLPAAGTELALRFYNGTTVAGSSFYNTVTAPTWLWQAPGSPPNNPIVNISLDDNGLVWESILRDEQPTSTAFHTSIPIAVPEPAALALFVVGGVVLHIAGGRAKK